ncbi:MAG: DNA recombinase, partial [Serratia marcescens]
RQRIYGLIRHYSKVAKLEVNAHPHMLRHGCGFAECEQRDNRYSRGHQSPPRIAIVNNLRSFPAVS